MTVSQSETANGACPEDDFHAHAWSLADAFDGWYQPNNKEPNLLT